MTTPSRGEGALRVADHPFFLGMVGSLIERIRRHAVERTFAVGDLLIREGDSAREFFLLYHGKVALEVTAPDRAHLTIQTIGPGEVLGWSWLVPPHRWQFDARALKPTRTVALDATVLRQVFEERPEDGYRFLLRLLPVIAERLANARIQLLDIHAA